MLRFSLSARRVSFKLEVKAAGSGTELPSFAFQTLHSGLLLWPGKNRLERERDSPEDPTPRPVLRSGNSDAGAIAQNVLLVEHIDHIQPEDDC
jgi:hypothetical protein